MDDIILNMLAKQSENFKRAGDYINSAGVLICGKCGGLRWTGKRKPEVDLCPAQLKLRFEKTI